MEYQKITCQEKVNIPDQAHKFNTKKWAGVYDQSGNEDSRYKPSKQIRFEKTMSQSNLFDYSDVYIVVKETVTVSDPDNAAYDKKLAFKNNAPFISFISKFDNTLIDNAEDLDIAMPMYNFIEYSKSYAKTSGTLWNYYRDEPNSGAEGNINYSFKDSKSSVYKISTTEKLEDGNKETEDVEIVLPIKYLSNFWKTLDMLLINYDVSLILT